MSAGPTPWVKKPIPVRMVQWEGTAAEASRIIDWVNHEGGTLRYVGTGEEHPLRDDNGQVDVAEFLVVRTQHGDARLDPGDWVIQGTAGEFYPIERDRQAETYEPYEPGYTVELGGERFTQAQWEKVIMPIQGPLQRLRQAMGNVETEVGRVKELLHDPEVAAAPLVAGIREVAWQGTPNSASRSVLVTFVCPHCGWLGSRLAKSWRVRYAPTFVEKIEETILTAHVECGGCRVVPELEHSLTVAEAAEFEDGRR